MLCVLDIDTKDREAAGRLVQQLMEIQIAQTLAGAPMPDLYRSGVRFRHEPPGQQYFRTAEQTARTLGGDCKNLVIWRCAELRRAGELVTPAVLWPRHEQAWRAHARVRRADGTLEDPSVELGMHARRRRR